MHTLDTHMLACTDASRSATRERNFIDERLAIWAGQHYNHVAIGAKHQASRCLECCGCRQVASETIGQPVRSSISRARVRYAQVCPARSPEVLQRGEADSFHTNRHTMVA
ncbi:MAG: hypothetical protein RL072_1519 [Actinomycetota bacterium]|jgi:hypothetical protein